MVSLFVFLRIALLAAVPSSLAYPAESLSQEGIQIMIEKYLDTSETDVSVIDKSNFKTLASSCSNHLDIPALNTSVTANVDDTGSGNLKLGDTVYKIHENTDISGGISCSRMYNEEQVFVICDVPLVYTERFVALLRRSAIRQEDCSRTRKPRAPEARSLKSHAMAMINGPGDEPSPALDAISYDDIDVPGLVEKRQGACGVWTGTTKPVANPDPHQNYYLKQLSENQFCGSQSCTVGETETFSITVGFTVGSGSDANGFVNAGFSVSASWSHSENHSCSGGPGETVCVWYNTAHTAYTVQNHIVNTICGGDEVTSDPFVMFSPNDNNVGGGFYCVAGTACRSVNSAYWDYSGRAGGP